MLAAHWVISPSDSAAREVETKQGIIYVSKNNFQPGIPDW